MWGITFHSAKVIPPSDLYSELQSSQSELLYWSFLCYFFCGMLPDTAPKVSFTCSIKEPQWSRKVTYFSWRQIWFMLKCTRDEGWIVNRVDSWPSASTFSTVSSNCSDWQIFSVMTSAACPCRDRVHLQEWQGDRFYYLMSQQSIKTLWLCYCNEEKWGDLLMYCTGFQLQTNTFASVYHYARYNNTTLQ